MLLRTTCFLALFPGLLHSQLQWEHTYAGAALRRIALDVSGETYLLANNCALQLYHADHTPWITETLTPPYSAVLCANYLLSEQYVDQDTGLEIIYFWSTDDDNCPVSGAALEDDDGSLSWLNKHSPYPVFSTPPGRAPKLLAGPVVYALPGAQVEHDYGAGKQAYRLELPSDGERYLVYDWTTGDFQGFLFYDATHTLVKTVNLPFRHFQDLHFVSQTFFNSDSLLEFAGVGLVNSSGANRYLLDVVQEDGRRLFSYPCESAARSQLENLPDRYLIRQTGPAGQILTLILDPVRNQILHTFSEKQVARFSPDGGSEMYWAKATDADSVVRVFNGQFEPEHTFTFPEPYRHFWNLQVTRGRFGASNSLEFCFTSARNGGTAVSCLGQNGELLYDFPGAKSALLDRRAGMEDMFFVSYPDSTAVHRFAGASTSTAATTEPAAGAPYPNPFDAELSLKMSDPAAQVRLLNLNGQLVQQIDPGSGALIRIPTGHLPPGIYFLHWDDGQRNRVFRIVKAPGR